MAKTREELVHQALRELEELPEGQAATAEQYRSVDRHVSGLLEDLRDREVVYVPNIELIDERFFIPLAKILADRSKPAFGMAGDQGLRAEALRAEADLAAMQQDGPTYEVHGQDGQYF